MTTMHERISHVIKEIGITKTAFADRINVGQPYVSKLCTGVSSPSDRTIADIVREFNVNEIWLRTGEGEMFVPVSQDEQIMAFLRQALNETGSFKYRFVSMLSQLSATEWEVLEHMVGKIATTDDKD